MSRHLGALFEDAGERPFLIDARQAASLSYRDVWAITARYRELFRGSGLSAGERVALCLPNSVELVCCYLACLFDRLTAVPINPSFTPRETSAILRLARPRVLVHTAETIDRSEAGAAEAAGLEYLAIAIPDPVRSQATGAPDEPRRLRPADLDIDEDVYLSIHFTSGTTGTPKGVVHTVRSLLSNAAAFNEAMGLSSGDRYLHVLPMSYMAGFLNTILCPLMAGASIVCADAFDAAGVLRFWNLAIEYDVTTMWLTPSILAFLNRADRNPAAPGYARSHIRHCFVGTAPLPRPTSKEFAEKYGIQPIESYGLSELLLISANAGTGGSKDGSVGVPLQGVAIDVQAMNGKTGASGGDGELSIETPYAMAGYFMAEGSDVVVTPPPVQFASGDNGHIDADGHLFITGRKKDIIICGGFNVSPRAVEDVIDSHPAVRESAVIGVSHPIQGEEVLAVLVLDGSDDEDTVCADVRSVCRAELNRLSVPSRFIVMDALPKSKVGKVQKNKLRAQLADGTAKQTA